MDFIAICAGKQSVVDFLVEEHGFRALSLKDQSEASSANGTSIAKAELSFHTVTALDDFVSKKWRQHWVVKQIESSEVLDLLSRRPYFLLVSVDAPVSVRWQRYKNR